MVQAMSMGEEAKGEPFLEVDQAPLKYVKHSMDLAQRTAPISPTKIDEDQQPNSDLQLISDEVGSETRTVAHDPASKMRKLDEKYAIESREGALSANKSGDTI